MHLNSKRYKRLKFFNIEEILREYSVEYPYEDRINSDDTLNCKDVFSSDGEIIGQVEAALGESFIVRSEQGNIEFKYEIPPAEIERIVDGAITVKKTREDIQKRYETSSIEKDY